MPPAGNMCQGWGRHRQINATTAVQSNSGCQELRQEQMISAGHRCCGLKWTVNKSCFFCKIRFCKSQGDANEDLFYANSKKKISSFESQPRIRVESGTAAEALWAVVCVQTITWRKLVRPNTLVVCKAVPIRNAKARNTSLSIQPGLGKNFVNSEC